MTPNATGGRTPVIVTVIHRGEKTRRMLEQLERVTGDHSLVIVNGGFDDPDYLKGLAPFGYAEVGPETTIAGSINAGLELAGGEYLAVLDSDVFIHDEGWLDHVTGFMDARPDVGLVGLGGFHSIDESGSVSRDPGVDHRAYSARPRPPFRFTEVAAVDGAGWVMRNLGFRLDEGLGTAPCYGLDLSCQYLQEGSRVYLVRLDLESSAGGAAAPGNGIALRPDTPPIGSSPAREAFLGKWGHMLPIRRAFTDERELYGRMDEMKDEAAELRGLMEELARRSALLEAASAEKTRELQEASTRIAELEGLNLEKARRMGEVECRITELEAALGDEMGEGVSRDPGL